MKCKNCKADNKSESICDAGIACYVLRCGEYGCALNGKTVDKLLRMKKASTNADNIRAMTDEELARAYVLRLVSCYGCEASTIEECVKCTLDWLRQEVKE